MARGMARGLKACADEDGVATSKDPLVRKGIDRFLLWRPARKPAEPSHEPDEPSLEPNFSENSISKPSLARLEISRARPSRASSRLSSARFQPYILPLKKVAPGEPRGWESRPEKPHLSLPPPPCSSDDREGRRVRSFGAFLVFWRGGVLGEGVESAEYLTFRQDLCFPRLRRVPLSGWWTNRAGRGKKKDREESRETHDLNQVLTALSPPLLQSIHPPALAFWEEKRDQSFRIGACHMTGTSDRGSIMEDWMAMPPTPSPRTLMSNFLSEDFSSGPFSNLFGEHGGNKTHDQADKRGEFGDLREQVPAQSAKATPQKDISLQPIFFNVNQKSNQHGGLAERMASRAGFSIPKIDTSRVGSSTVVRSPISIPPGLSPTTLLESPVFLFNNMAQPSPTTGKLPFLMATDANSTMPPAAKMNGDSTFGNDVFSFQPHLGPKEQSLSYVEKGYNACHQNQSLSNIHQQESSLQSSFTALKDTADETIVKPKTSDSMFGDTQSSEEQEDDEADQNGEYTSATISTPAEDGYNWRKYGQKQVKSCEHPRSYYKCTHPNCPVKKKVERSQDGQITEIIYKGSHDHPLPPPNRRSGVSSSHINDPQVHVLERPGTHTGFNSASLWGNDKSGCIQDVQSEGVEGRPSASPHGDTSTVESHDAVDVSSTLSNEEMDRATHGTVSIDCDGGEDETEYKRRKVDALAAATIPAATTTTTIDMVAAASRAVREPRVVVQTTSEVDILDDGYRWRKYGQKVVKGNPNPRSYYKCTHPGCSVRKHVERASHDLKSVITTYEGKHNHEVPAARNSGHGSSGSGSAPPSAPQASLSHRRQEQAAQGNYAQFGGASPFGSFGIPPRGHLGAAPGNFRFGMAPPGMSMPMPMPAARHPSMMQGFPGLMIPEGQPKAEPETQSGFPAANAAYQQMMMSRPPFDSHQM